MPLKHAGFSAFQWGYNNLGAPSATPGTLITAGGSNAEGSWTQIASGANIANDVYGIGLWLTALSGTGDRQLLLDIGVDPAGGTSYTAVVSNMVVGNFPTAVTAINSGTRFLFPLFIKAGSSVAVRAQGNNVTGPTFRVVANFFGHPTRPESALVGTFAETIGTITNSQGVGFTPGNNAWGSYQLLGATVAPLWWWQGCYSINNGTITAEYTYIEFSYGDASNKIPIMTLLHAGTTAEVVCDMINANQNIFNCYEPVPAGTNIYVRGFCQNAPDTGYNAVMIGIGG
jgi:hypothetical protein